MTHNTQHNQNKSRTKYRHNLIASEEELEVKSELHGMKINSNASPAQSATAPTSEREETNAYTTLN